jgi:ElaB/YqjD/DUF883 family membrane-anchored ribosome-binding protein
MSTTAKVEAGVNRAKKATRNVVDDTSSVVSREYHNFVADIEDLIKSSTTLTGEELDKAREKIGERIAEAKESLTEVGDTIVERARKTAEVTDQYVHEQPWSAVGAGAALGLLVGFLIARR